MAVTLRSVEMAWHANRRQQPTAEATLVVVLWQAQGLAPQGAQR
jgi:hypothetical protein